MRRRAWVAAALLLPAAGLAQEHLIPGPGSTLTENKCKICHELQHIQRAQLSPGEWSDNIKNMRERGAPMTDAEAEVIHRYLSTYYNRERPAPPPSPDTLAGGGGPAQQLLNAHACTGCHARDERVVGPSFKEVASRYAGQAGAAQALAQKVRRGGAGTWGQVPMPPNPGLSDADLAAMIAWVLEQR